MYSFSCLKIEWQLMLIQQRFCFFNEILDEMCSTNTQLARFVVMARNMSLIYLFARGQDL